MRAEPPCRRGEVVRGLYVIGDAIGIGGMGIVYRGVQTALDRTIAIKLPKPEHCGNPMIRYQFQMEALACARIKHRNVVGVVDFGQHHGAPYLVMEHVPGPRLSKVLQADGPLTVPNAVSIARQILSGLADAHANEVAHGDVKCDNVLVERLRDGTTLPRLIDFGLARFISSPPIHALESPMVVGTPDYLAPELIRGHPATYASDVYAMGMVLWELIAGEPPFSGGTPERTMRRQLSEVPPLLSSKCPGIPPELDAIVARALAKLPTERFEDAAAMHAALDEIPIQPVAPPRVEPPILLVNRKREPTPVDRRRLDVVDALRAADIDAAVVAYLELTQCLVDGHDLPMAIAELEEGIDLIEHVIPEPAAPLWRLQLTLAAMYDGSGDRVRACQTLRDAHLQASRAGSAVGQRRARELFGRLGLKLRASGAG